jgi:hypothetical protein
MEQSTVAPLRRFLDEDTLRAAAVEAARFACNGTAGRVLGDPVFELVTEERNHGKGYAACGALAHHVLRELGCRDERVRVGARVLRGWLDVARLPGLLAK